MANATRLYTLSSPLSENHHKVHWSWCNSFSHFKIVTTRFPLLPLSLRVLNKMQQHEDKSRSKLWILNHTHFSLFLIHPHAWTGDACLSWWECVINVLWRGASAQWQWKTTYWLLILPVNVATGHSIQACFSSGGWMGESYAERRAQKRKTKINFNVK